MDTCVVDRVLDAKGLLCPEPLMLLHKLVNELGPGEIIKMETTDTSARRDVERFCSYLGHRLLEVREQSGVQVFWLRKGCSNPD